MDNAIGEVVAVLSSSAQAKEWIRARLVPSLRPILRIEQKYDLRGKGGLLNPKKIIGNSRLCQAQFSFQTQKGHWLSQNELLHYNPETRRWWLDAFKPGSGLSIPRDNDLIKKRFQEAGLDIPQALQEALEGFVL